MWVCVVITFSVIGFAWFRTTSRQFVALLNPKQVQQTEAVARAREEPASPFATLFLSIKDLKASLWDLFNFSQKSNDIEVKNPGPVQPNEANQPITPQPLPLSP